MICAHQPEPIGLPLQLIGAFHRDGEFGDSPRDRVLAQLEVGASQMKSPAFLPESVEQNSMQGSSRKRGSDQRSKKQGPSLKPASNQCASDAALDQVDGLVQDQDGSGRIGDQVAPWSKDNVDIAKTNDTSESKTSVPNQAKSSTPAEVNAAWPENATTVMLRNIPNRYTPEELLAEMIAAGFDNTFNFFYLPIDFSTKRNRGYGFINFRDPENAKKFVEAFHQQRLTRYATQKILEVSPALTQGFDANVSQYVRKDAQRIQNPWFRPMIFSFDEEENALAQLSKQA